MRGSNNHILVRSLIFENPHSLRLPHLFFLRSTSVTLKMSGLNIFLSARGLSIFNMVPRVISTICKLLRTIMISVSIVSTICAHKYIKSHSIFALVRVRKPFLNQLRGLRGLKRLFFLQSVSRLSLIPLFSLFGILFKDLNLLFQIRVVFLVSM